VNDRDGSCFLKDETLAAISVECFGVRPDTADRATALSRLRLWQKAYAEMEAAEVAGVEPAFLLSDEA
jgi:hypothetical protein